MNERDDLKAYLDGELPEPRAEEVRLALERDPDLREEYTFMKLLTKEIQSTAKEPEVKGVDGARAAARRKPWYLKPPALLVEGLAALFLIGTVGSALFPVYAQSKTAAMQTMAKADYAGAEAKTMSAQPRELSGRAQGEATAGERVNSATPASPKADVPTQGLSDLPARGGYDGQADAKAPSFANGRSVDGSSASVEKPKSLAPLATPSVASPAQREVVKSGSVGVTVKDTKKAMQIATDTVKSMNGFVESSNVSKADKDIYGYMTLRVPAANFEALVNVVRGLGDVVSETLSGQDVTGSVADMGARLNVLRSEEESYVQMLRQSRKLQDTLDLRDRLSTVRQEIESIDAQRKALASVAATSTLQVQFNQGAKPEPAAPKGDWFGESTKGATAMLMQVGQTVVSGLLYVAILSPVWVPVALLAWWASRRKKAA